MRGDVDEAFQVPVEIGLEEIDSSPLTEVARHARWMARQPCAQRGQWDAEVFGALLKREDVF